MADLAAARHSPSPPAGDQCELRFFAMRSGVWNIGFGLVAVAAGASGRFTLLGTGSSTALMVVGGLLAAFGLTQLVRSRGK